MAIENAQFINDIINKWYDKAAALVNNPPGIKDVREAIIPGITDEEADVIRRMDRPVLLIRDCDVVPRCPGASISQPYRAAMESEKIGAGIYEWCITEGGEPTGPGNGDDWGVPNDFQPTPFLVANSERISLCELDNIGPTFYVLLQKLLPGEVDLKTFTVAPSKGNWETYGHINDNGLVCFDTMSTYQTRKNSRYRASLTGLLGHPAND